MRGLEHLLSEGCGESASEDIKSNMFSEILTINKYLIPVLAWQAYDVIIDYILRH